jgi:hypothetical protein
MPIENPHKNLELSKLLILGGSIVVVIGVGYYFFYKPQGSKISDSSAFVVTPVETLKAHESGNRDEAVANLKRELPLATDVSAKAQNRLLLAANLLVRNEGDDRVEGYRIYKQMATDPNMPAKYQALALAEMAFSMDWIGDHDALMNFVFNEAPYDQILKDSNHDMHLAMIRVYEMSDRLYPNTIAKTQIGFMYAVRLINGMNIPGKSVEESAQIIQKYVRAGEPLLSDFPYRNSYLSHLSLCKAMAMGISNRILKNLSWDEIDATYKNAIDIAAARPDDVFSRGAEEAARLMYATSLNSRFGEEKKSEVLELLKIFSESDINKSLQTVEYLKGVKNRPDTDFAKKQILALAQISTDLRSFMQKMGWSV